MKKLPVLKPGDSVELVAPAARCNDKLLSDIRNLLISWRLKCIVDENIFGDDLLCANTDEIRFQSLKNALLNPETKAVICVRGGYGSMRLIPELTKVQPPATTKLFIGLSDITALHIFLQQHWHWPVIHGALSLDKFTPESIEALKSLMFGQQEQIPFHGKPLNTAARKHRQLEASLTGGNLCLIQSGIGTQWQLNGRDKIILLEDVGERGYRIDRMLEQLRQANMFKDTVAIVLGDFLDGNEPDGSSLVRPVIERFASQCDIPVVQVAGIGHGKVNLPIPLGTKASLQLGDNIQLTCYR